MTVMDRGLLYTLEDHNLPLKHLLKSVCGKLIQRLKYVCQSSMTLGAWSQAPMFLDASSCKPGNTSPHSKQP
eukprot:Em0194g7a